MTIIVTTTTTIMTIIVLCHNTNYDHCCDNCYCDQQEVKKHSIVGINELPHSARWLFCFRQIKEKYQELDVFL